MAINYELVTTGSAPSEQALLLPFSDLLGLQDASELGNSTEEDDSKISQSLFRSMQNAIAQLNSPLGIAQTKPNPTGAGNDIVRQVISLTWSYVADLVENEAVIYPRLVGSSDVPEFADFFPNAEVISDTGSATADSLAFTTSELALFDADEDATALRDTMVETLTRIAFSAPIRSGTKSSSVFAKAKGNTNGIAQPANFFSNTTFDQSDANNLAFFNIQYSMTQEFKLNPDTQVYDVNVVTS
jgi:hypothetical protein